MITLTHPTQSIKLTQFNLKRSLLSDVLTANIATSIDYLFLGDTITLYDNNTVVFSGELTEIREVQLVAITNTVTTGGTYFADKVVFYNKDTIRVPLDFDIVSGMDFSSDTHSLVTGDITHYNYFSEVLI